MTPYLESGTVVVARAARAPGPLVRGGDIVLQAPPEVPKSTPSSMVTKLMPLVMVVSMVGMSVMMFTSGGARNPMSLMFPVMMLGSMATMFTQGGRGGAKVAELNEDRRDYLRYLDATRSDVRERARAQSAALRWAHPRPSALTSLVGTTRMWERSIDDGDFCHVRTGIGSQRLTSRLIPPDLGPMDDLDPVSAMSLRTLIRTHSITGALPIAVALRGFAAVAVRGPRDATRALLRAMVCELAVLHGPDAVLLCVITAEGDEEWDWIKWLPHSQHPSDTDALGTGRMVFASLAHCEQSLEQILAGRERFSRTAPTSPDRPHLVVIADGSEATGRERLFTDHGIDSVTLLSTDPDRHAQQLAESRGLILELDAEHLYAVSPAGREKFASPDQLDRTAAQALAMRLARYRSAAALGTAARPAATVTTGWTHLMGIGDPARFEADPHWAAMTARNRLRVPIGYDEQGLPVALDLKESAEGGIGPHGLCVGATGSGKSEFLRTLTLGLLASHSPSALNLILVDFKGGATFLGMDTAPHVAAVITNLADEAQMVARMQDALAGELNRRQELLRSAGNFTNVTEYERARAAGTPLAPLPALVIIVDEFSELLSQHPDFAELFVAIGRLGRSLHIHLLLASQRLDEGRLRGLDSHLSYRIGLKTFSANESRAVLGVPDAYHLPSVPGSGYLKSDASELRRFAAAYVSGTYRREVVGADPVTTAAVPQLFTAAPQHAPPVELPVAADGDAESGATLLTTMLDAMAGRGPRAHEVWLPPLGESATLGQFTAGSFGVLAAPIAIVDRPYEQRRDLMVVDVSGAAGHVAIIGGPQSGKSTTLRTLIVSMAARYDSRHARFYCLDFGGGALSALARLPQVGVVASRLDHDQVRRTIAEMSTVIRHREALFARERIESMDEYRRRAAEFTNNEMHEQPGDVFLVIDGWSTIRGEFEALEDQIQMIAARGLSYGVHLVIAATRWAELRAALKDNLGTRIELRLGDPTDSEIDRRVAATVPVGRPGRGLTPDRKHMLIALPQLDPQPRPDGLALTVERITSAGGPIAPRVRLLPEHVTGAELGVSELSGRVPFGLSEHDLSPAYADLVDQPHLLIFGGPECGKTTLLHTLGASLIASTTPEQTKLIVVDFRRTLLGCFTSDHVAGYTATSDVLAQQLPHIVAKLRERLPDANVTPAQLRDRSWWSGPDIYLMVDDYDLVATATGNPLAALTEFLPHAKDIGLHVIIARRSGGAARALYEPMIARIRDLDPLGFVMSTTADDGVLLGSVRPAMLPPGRGTLLSRRGEWRVQVARFDGA